jgi:hypothetical protein
MAGKTRRKMGAADFMFKQNVALMRRGERLAELDTPDGPPTPDDILRTLRAAGFAVRRGEQ